MLTFASRGFVKIALCLGAMAAIAVAGCGSDIVPIDSRAAALPKTQPSDTGGIVVSDTTAGVVPSATPTRADSTPRTPTDSNSTPTPPDTTHGTPVPPPPPTPPPPPPIPQTAADSLSPTGRSPRLIWTPEKQATWSRMRQENHPLYQLLANNCQLAVNGSPRYGDRGLWCTIMYQITGEVTYARTAWRIAQPYVTSPPRDANDTREEFIENAIVFDWLYPALTPAERESAVLGLNIWGNYALAIGTPQWVGGIRTSDSDASIGYYFGLAAADLATSGLSANHVNWLSKTQTLDTPLPVGGLDATGIDRRTARNTISQYVQQLAAGGEWFESSEYNINTQVLLAMGAAAVRTATGVDHFPEITSYLVDAARAQAYFITPDLAQSVQWGDVEHPRGFVEKLWQMSTLFGALAGESKWSAAGGPYIQGLQQALFAKYGMSGYDTAEPWARFFLFYDPYAPSVDWSSGVVARYFAGTGHVFVHDGASLFEARMAPPTGVDHDVGWLSDLQLYSNGEWTITHPLGYGGSAVLGPNVNGVLLAGLSAMLDKGPETVQSGNDWWAITGSTSGAFYGNDYWDPPPAFVRIWRRTVVYLKRAGFDIVVTQDTVDADDPRSMGNLSRYRSNDLAAINGAGGLVQWLLHAPVFPTINGTTASWRTPHGQNVAVISLSPGNVTLSAVSETSALDPASYYPQEIAGYQLRVTPAFTGGQVVLRNVILVGNGTLPAVTLTGTTIHIGNTTITMGASVQVTN